MNIENKQTSIANSEDGSRRIFWARQFVALGVIAFVIWLFVAPNFVSRGLKSPINTCKTQLRQIDAAVQIWARDHDLKPDAIVVQAEVLDYLRGSQLPVCPLKGKYTLPRTVGEVPSCNIPGHTL